MHTDNPAHEFDTLGEEYGRLMRSYIGSNPLIMVSISWWVVVFKPVALCKIDGDWQRVGALLRFGVFTGHGTLYLSLYILADCLLP